MADREYAQETLCLHAGQIPDPLTGSRAPPIYQTTSYVFDSADHAASLFNLETFGVMSGHEWEFTQLYFGKIYLADNMPWTIQICSHRTNLCIIF